MCWYIVKSIRFLIYFGFFHIHIYILQNQWSYTYPLGHLNQQAWINQLHSLYCGGSAEPDIFFYLQTILCATFSNSGLIEMLLCVR